MPNDENLNAIELAVFRHLFAAIPEEMGLRLRAASFSPNIKERLDFSCALTGPDGAMAAQASHIPVHLGAVHVTGRTLHEEVTSEPGDVFVVNDPWRGGTHLPDITLWAPFFPTEGGALLMGVLARAHHADVGGATPGSMGPAIDVHGEGIVIPPVRLVRRGELDRDVLEILLANTRTPAERKGDLEAQLAAVRLGVQRLSELTRREDEGRVRLAIGSLRTHAANVTRAMIRGLKDGDFAAEVALDGPETATIRVAARKRGGRLAIDFAGTDPAIEAPFNANRAITLSAVFYVVRLLLGEDVPTNSGCLDPISVSVPAGSLLDAPRPSAVAGGNVETSQRIVDALLLALGPAAPGRLPAPSQGTMNNLTAGGRDGRGEPWTFYETLAGGAGGGPQGPGESGIQTHMTNTLNTPIEALERAYPVRVDRYELRRGSGGAGRHPGGEGLVREITFTERARVTILAHRREQGAPGAAGGERGQPGRDQVRVDGRWRALHSGESRRLGVGDAVRIATPGGGGYGNQRGGEER